MTSTVCIVGLGYVGLPLAIEFDRAGHHVVGYDVDADRVGQLDDGQDPTGEFEDETVADCGVVFTDDSSLVGDAEYVVITVPTPVDTLQNPNMEFVEAAGRTVGENLRPGATVVLESTVFPGATRNVLLPVLESSSGLVAGEDFFVGYSPERVSPGDRDLGDAVKIVSGQTEAVRDDLAQLYESVVDAGVYRAPDIETAEAAKVIENVQRDINIALVNELAIVCEHIGLEAGEVLDAASTKWNFHDEYSPGLVGGHCIPVDPLFLVHRSEREGFSPKLLLQAREINKYVPKHVAELVIKALNQCRKVPSESRLLVLGLSYKPNVGDIRTSAVGDVIAELDEYDVGMAAYDPHVADEELGAAFDVEVLEELSFEGMDGVLLATPHDEFRDFELLDVARQMNERPFLFDVNGVFDEARATDAGFRYDSL